MSLSIFLAVLFAALLHAGWNGIIKFGDDKLKGMFVMSLVQGGIGLVLVLGSALPRGEIWLWLVVSTILHSAYKAFLTLAYERGDLSRVYPIARGTAPMIVALLSVFLLDDLVTAQQYFGIFLVGCGILLMARGVFTGGESRKLLPFAFASALATAAYSLVDGVGARLLGDASVFVAWAFFLDGLLFGGWAIYYRGRAAIATKAQHWGMGAIAAAASYAAYWIVVTAMTQAPIALVTALRETSVLFAVLIGVVFFKDPADRGKIIAVGLILAGVVLTRL